MLDSAELNGRSLGMYRAPDGPAAQEKGIVLFRRNECASGVPGSACVCPRRFRDEDRYVLEVGGGSDR